MAPEPDLFRRQPYRAASLEGGPFSAKLRLELGSFS